MSKKRRKMAIQLFVITFAVIAVMIGALLIIQSVYFESFYLSWKTEKLERELSKFAKAVSESEINYVDYLELKHNFVLENNANVSTLLENGNSLEQKLKKNQKWYSVTIRYESGINKKVILSEHDIFTYLMRKSINVGEEYYISTENIDGVYQYCDEIFDIKSYNQFFTDESIQDFVTFDSNIGYDKVEIVDVEEATKEERYRYSTIVMNGDIVIGAAYSGVIADTIVISVFTDQQISFTKEATGTDGELMRFYLTASIQPVDEATLAITSYYPWFFLVAVITALIVAFLYARRVSGPIGRISKAAEMMSEGNLDTRITSNYKNEIGVLADSLNQLSQNLSSSLGELEAANEKLLDDIAQKEHDEQVRREFTANVSHDLKTPLGVMRCYAELLRDNIEPDKNNEYIEVLLLEIDKMNKMVLQMLQLAKAESGNANLNKISFSIKDMIEETVAMFSPILKEKNIEVSITGEFNDILADQKRMEQVVINLIANASEYAHENSMLELKGESVNNKCRISIKNECDPITQEQADQLFKRFYTLNKARNANGTGLGLAICAAIFDLHGLSYGATAQGSSIAFWFEYSCR